MCRKIKDHLYTNLKKLYTKKPKKDTEKNLPSIKEMLSNNFFRNTIQALMIG